MKNKTKVIFRADGNKEIGMGHFIRSIALAEMINKNFTCIFACSQPSEYQKKEALQVCESIIELPGGDLHYQEFLDHIHPGDIIVLDNYFYDTGYQNEIKGKGCKLVFIDDIHDKHYVADLVINHSPSVTEGQFDVENYTKLLLGPSYTLLRKEFLEYATHQPSLPSNGSVLLCFGGIDKFNLSLKYIKLLIKINPDLKFNVVAGAESDSYRSIKEWISEDSQKVQVNIHSNVSAENLLKLIKDSSIAIVPSSGIMYEVIAVRRKVITGYFVDNQRNIANNISSDEGGIFFAGNLKEPDEDFFKGLLQKISEVNYLDVFQYQSSLIDGKSGNRILNEFIGLT